MFESEPLPIRLAALTLYFASIAELLSVAYQAEALAMVLLPFIAAVVYLVRQERTRQPTNPYRLH